MTAYTVPQIGDKVRNIYTDREFVVTRLDVIDFEQGDGPELCVAVKGDRGEDDVWSGKVTAFEPAPDEVCCPACTEAATLTGRDAADVLNRPWIGRPPKQLQSGDVIRSVGNGPHVLGDVTREGGAVYVQWRDRTAREELRGGMALQLRINA